MKQSPAGWPTIGRPTFQTEKGVQKGVPFYDVYRVPFQQLAVLSGRVDDYKLPTRRISPVFARISPFCGCEIYVHFSCFPTFTDSLTCGHSGIRTDSLTILRKRVGQGAKGRYPRKQLSSRLIPVYCKKCH